MRKNIKYFLIGATLLLVGSAFIAAGDSNFKLGRNMEILVNMMRDVNMFYVDETDPDKLLQDAAAGMLKNLDPYTEYLSAKDMEAFQILTTGKYGGIGSLIRKKDEYTIIAQPYKGSPADKAGLKVGDRLLEVNGVSAMGLESEKVSAMLKGDPGTSLTLKVLKLIGGKEETLTITRERIAIPGVPYYGFVNDSIGYIQHGDFSENCSEDMRMAFMELRKGGKLKGLILDYRGNGGGILQEAVKIVSMFVPKGTQVVSMKGRTPETCAVFKTGNEPIDTQIPIAVLTNSGSASAAEIVSGALQDLDRAVLVGQRTFGKGLVQSPRPVGYNSYLKVTIAKYYIPSGRCIQAIDYAHRNEDGSVSSVPDSLVRAFVTKAGRKVYDGGGVMPDVKIAPEYLTPFSIVVYARGYIDDFADEYVKRNPKPMDLAKFSITDNIYAEFVKFMEDKDVEYQSETKTALAELKSKAERELYYETIKEQVDQIEKRLKNDKLTNLKLCRDQISEMLETSLILHHYYTDGLTEYKLRSDKELKEAVKILQSGERYRAIVSSQDTAQK